MSKEKILGMYDDAIKISKDINEKKYYIEEKKKERAEILHKYRVESVCRVLDFVRGEYGSGSEVNIELLLCHCQNKLRGNIDGVELDLKRGAE